MLDGEEKSPYSNSVHMCDVELEYVEDFDGLKIGRNELIDELRRNELIHGLQGKHCNQIILLPVSTTEIDRSRILQVMKLIGV